ncbi:hypothetical protein MMC20_000794 [Loxospora ochrophaea]|nr:hypothetical protein [Loxospora ochrophaea]
MLMISLPAKSWQRIFLLKFAKPNNRQQLIIDSGFRCHLSEFTRTTASTPSAFVARLRKFLRTRRVTSVSQIGTDRVIEIQFSDGQYRLFLEFYAGGNIILTDKELSIIALLRIVGEGQDQEELRVGLKYSLHNRQNYNGVPELTKERVKAGLQDAFDKTAMQSSAPAKNSKKKAGDALRRALATSITEYPPMLLDHAFRVKGFDSATTVEQVLNDEPLLGKLMTVLDEAGRVVQDITSLGSSKGYIIAKPAKSRLSIPSQQAQGNDTEEVGKNRNVIYDDFHPFRPKQFEDDDEIEILEFDGFNKTVDEFFSSIETQKLDSRLTEREENAKRKLEAAKRDHEKRIGGLQQVQELNVRKAQAIEGNLQRVQEAIAAINGLIAQGMDWVEIARLIEMEQSRHNPVAEMIKLPLKLYENTATILLAESTDDDDFEADETDSDVSEDEDEKAEISKIIKHKEKRLAVDVDLALSPWSNARQYYDQKRTAAVKEQKTLQSSTMALKSTEKKIAMDLKKGLKQEKDVLRPVRKQLWFEKFIYFISSDGYLVLGGKDVQQTEILYKKYLKRGDVYIHADLNGAAPFIIKNKSSMADSPIPPSTLSQAGTICVATSSAWDSKAVMSAWWVNSDQVSKMAPTGEFLSTGGFTIQGAKNFLPPAQLLLGLGVMFQISEESKARHLKHRFHDEDITSPSKIDANNKIQPSEEEYDHAASDHEDDNSDHITNSVDGVPNRALGESDESNHHDAEQHSESESDEDNDPASVNEYQNPLQSTANATVEEDMNNRDSSLLKHAPTYQSRSSSQSAANEAGGEESEERDEPRFSPESDEREFGSDHAEQRQALSDTDDFRTTSHSPNSLQSNSGSASGVRHLSAKERRLLRKGQIPPANPSNHTEPTLADRSASLGTVLPPISNSTAKPFRPVRGKHGKIAKQKTKYANQDDSDRALALRLLGSAPNPENSPSASDSSSTVSHEARLAAQKARRREQHLRAAQAETARRANMDEGIETPLDPDEAAELQQLDCLVGTPLPRDVLQEALVVCGPWDAVGGKCRWRAKLQPGQVKKGKAVREVLGKWGVEVAAREKRKGGPREGEEGWEEESVRRREGELVRGLREPDVIGVVPVGKVRVLMGGGGDGSKARGGGGGGRGGRGGRGSKRK